MEEEDAEEEEREAEVMVLAKDGPRGRVMDIGDRLDEDQNKDET